MLRPDYRGPFDPDLTLASLSRQLLAHLGRETLLIGHLFDRVSQPLVAMGHGAEGYTRSAIDEWMAASPVYSKRMQRLMGFEGRDVGTVFKNLQLDIGAPHQFMDFQFRLDSPEYGEFWLCHCGALLDVEKAGSERGVRIMCHDIEDPTFDATAAATHPRMVMRPIHRPPRIDGEGGNGRDRWPHCRWKVFLAEEATPADPHPELEAVAASAIANAAVWDPGVSAEPGGFDDYAGPFDPHLQLEDFSHRALVRLNQEFALQAQLLIHSYQRSQIRHHGKNEARDLVRRAWTGFLALGAVRVSRLLGIEADPIEERRIEAVAKVLQLHPAFQPRSVLELRVEVADSERCHVSVGGGAAFDDEIPHPLWDGQGDRQGDGRGEPHADSLAALAQVVNPRARCRVTEASEQGLGFEIHVDPGAPAAPEPPELGLARMSGGLGFRFEQRRLLRGEVREQG
ncbi:MAG: hypothetical protein QNK05_06325 [Myxococcota bacterium]|nr:hypothetical protein [Myxococcota bacterium]